MQFKDLKDISDWKSSTRVLVNEFYDYSTQDVPFLLWVSSISYTWQTQSFDFLKELQYAKKLILDTFLSEQQYLFISKEYNTSVILGRFVSISLLNEKQVWCYLWSIFIWKAILLLCAQKVITSLFLAYDTLLIGNKNFIWNIIYIQVCFMSLMWDITWYHYFLVISF